MKSAPSAVRRFWTSWTPTPAARNGGEIKTASTPAVANSVTSNRRNATGLNAQRSLSGPGGSEGALAGAGCVLIWSSVRGVPSEDTPVSVRWVERAPFRVLSPYVLHRRRLAGRGRGAVVRCPGESGRRDQGGGGDRPALDGVPPGAPRRGRRRACGDRAATRQRGHDRARRRRAGATTRGPARAGPRVGGSGAGPGKRGRDAADGRGVARLRGARFADRAAGPDRPVASVAGARRPRHDDRGVARGSGPSGRRPLASGRGDAGGARGAVRVRRARRDLR